MSKAIIGKWMGAKFVLVFALALVMLGAGMVSAQTNTSTWNFAPLNFNVASGGGQTLISGAQAILGATDVNNNTFSGNEDGAIIDNLAGSLIMKPAPSGGLGIRSRPIIANIQTGDPLFMVAVIQGVSSAVVTGIRSGDSSAVASVISSVTATFPSELFEAHTAPGDFVALSPNSATGVANAFGTGIDPATSVVLIWDDLANLIVDATQAQAVLNAGVQATVYISSGDTAAHIGTSNWVGAEIGTAKETGPIVGTAEITGATDTTTLLARTGVFGLQSLPRPLPTGFQFRASDLIEVNLSVNANAAADGEPDVYFATPGDPLILSVPTGSGTGAGIGTSASISSNVTALSVPAAYSGGFFPGGDPRVSFFNPSNPNGDIILSVTSMIDPTVQTFGPQLPFTFTISVADDVGSATSATATGQLDTVPVAVTNITVDPEGDPLGTGAGIGNRNKISTRQSPNFNQVNVTVDVFPGGENIAAFNQWLSAAITTDSADMNLQDLNYGWNSETFGNWVNWRSIGTAASNSAIYGTTIVTNVPGVPTGTVTGVRMNAWLDNDLDTTVANAYAIVSVSDDARNFAVSRVNSVQSVEISSLQNFDSIYQNSSRTVNAATLTVDNNPPYVEDAILSVIGMPANYLSNFNNLDPATGRKFFGELRSTYEALETVRTRALIDALISGGATEAAAIAQVLSASAQVMDITRGTAAIDLPENELDQNGSPLKIVVRFDPATDSGVFADNDMDQIVPPGVSDLTYISQAFSFQFANASLGFATATNPPSWTVVDARAANAENFYATLELQSGIPALPVNTSVKDARLTMTVRDTGFNFAPNEDSTGITVDVDRPQIVFAPSNAPLQLAAGIGGRAATTTVLIANTNNQSLTQLEATGYDRDTDWAVGFFESVDNDAADNQDFINSAGTIAARTNHVAPGTATVADVTTPPQVNAGNMIILSANFQENAADELFDSYGNRGAFPYLLSQSSQTAANEVIDPATRLWGSTFKTIAADFSDFDTAAREVLPDVTRNVTQGGTSAFDSSDLLGDEVAGDIIAATWYFLVSSNSSTLNGAIGTDTIRSATLIARDLSGNVVRRGVKIGTSDFAAPSASILAYKINTAKVGIFDATIQATGEYNNSKFASASAFDISGATATVGSVLTVVAQGNNGPFLSGSEFRADFTDFGGSASESPASTSFSGTVGYATFVFTVPAGAASKGTVGATADVQVRVNKAIGTFSTVNTTGIMVDANAPTVDVGEIVQLSANYTDNLTDQLVRLNQPISVTAEVTVSSFETSAAVLEDFDIQGRVRESDGDLIGAVFAPTSGPDRQGNSNRYIYTFTPNLTNPFVGFASIIVEVTDAAGNKASDISPSEVVLENDAPIFTSIALSANSEINYVSGTQGVEGTFRPIVSSGTDVVGAGDIVRIVVEFNPQDPIFNIPGEFTVRGNFAQINGQTDVAANAVARSGPILVATFEQQVSSVVGNVTAATVILSVTDPAGVGHNPASPNVSPSVDVDTIPPVVTVETQFFGNNNLPISDLNNKPGASAAVVVTATYADANSYVFADGPGQVLTAAGIANVTELVSIDFSQFSTTKTTIAPDFIVLSQVAGATNITSASAPADFQNNKDIVVTAFFGRDPRFPGNTSLRLPVTEVSVANASIIALASDTVGNTGTASSSSILVDVQPPIVSNINLNVAPSAVAFAQGGYVPGIYAGDTILRPTRVAQNTPMTLSFGVIELPSAVDGGQGRVDLDQFGAADQTFTFSSEGGDNININFNVGPTNNDSPNTLPLANVNPLNAANYNVGAAINRYNAGTFPASIIGVTDTRGNAAQYWNGQRIEIDREGPLVLAQGFALYNSVETIRGLNQNQIPVNNAVVNAAPGQWIVYAASFVVDGTDVVNGEFAHFRNFSVDFAGRFGTRIAQTESGFALVEPQSATRTIVFATYAAQFSPNAISSEAIRVNMSVSDALGNTTATSPSTFISVNAEGSRAIEMELTVNGRNRSNGFNLNQLGIGANTVDAAQAVFEMAPGNTLIVEATVTTFQNAAPNQITLDLSDLYPPSMKNSVDEILPTSAQLTGSGIVYVRWEQILTADPTRTDNLTIFGDADVVTLAAQNNIAGTLFANANILAPTTGALAAADSSVQSASLAEIKGLPFIQLQNGAIAKNVANVTITVADPLSPFAPATTVSLPFATDAREPVASYTIAVVDRALEPTATSSQGGRAGFPDAPNLGSAVPNRVRGGDVIEFTNTIVNPTIAGNGNDRFVDLPGEGETLDLTDVFMLGEQPLEVTADLSEFNTSLREVRATEGGTLNTVTYDTIVAGVPTNIIATFEATVGSDIGTTMATSDDIRSITPTVVDDAGNRPLNSAFDFFNLNRLTNLAVDNTPPAISGSLAVVNLTTGLQVSGGTTIAPGTILGVTVTITDLVDNPLDVVQNPNFGNAILTVEGFDQATVVPLIGQTRFTGLNSIQLPFQVTMPGSENAFSDPAFRFIIQATDTIGNTAVVGSLDTFAFDANPALAVTGAQDGVVTINAEDAVTLTATAEDVGGIQALQWVVPEDLSGVTLVAVPESESDFIVNPSNPAATKTATLGLQVTPSLAAQPSFTLIATATDVDSFATSQTVTVNINQPALFAEVFDVTTTAANTTVTAATVAASVTGWNKAAGVDVREVTIEEGSSVLIDVLASDVFGDEVVFTAAGTAVDQGAVLTSTGAGMAQVAFTPGYRAVTGTDTSAVFTLDVNANDGTNITPDVATLVINVLARPSVPELDVVSVTVDGVPVNVSLGGNVTVPEGQQLVVVLSATDEGGEDLTFNATTSPAGVNFTSEVSATAGEATATVTFTPDFEFSDLARIAYDNPLDPFFFNFSVSNSGDTTAEILGVDVTNVSQGPIVSATATVDGGTPQPVEEGVEIPANAGSTVVLNVATVDPDGDLLFVPTVVVNSTNPEVVETHITTGSGSALNTAITLTIPGDICAGQEALIGVEITATDSTNASTVKTYTIRVTPGAETGGYDEIVIAQGAGGTNAVNVRNMDPTVGALTNILRSMQGAPQSFLGIIGGGLGRATYLANGDVDGDGDEDVVVTLGPTTEDGATFPNIVIPRDARTKEVIKGSFSAFPITGSGASVYTEGDIRAAVGNFTGDAPAQIALAQGIGGSGYVRIFQYTGLDAPNHFALVSQIPGLVAGAQTANANGGVNVAAGDVDNDGLDELFVSQSFSASSRAIVHMIELNATGGVARRLAFQPFGGNLLGEEGTGVELTVTDTDGDGTNEIVASAQGIGARAVTQNGNLINLIAVLKPTVTSGQVTGFTTVPGGVRNIFSAEANPSGVLNVAAGEFDNCAGNGDELVVGTGAIVGLDGEFSGEAPQSKYRIIKLDYNGSSISSVVNFIGSGSGFNAFSGTFEPESHSIDIVVGDTN